MSRNHAIQFSLDYISLNTHSLEKHATEIIWWCQQTVMKYHRPEQAVCYFLETLQILQQFPKLYY